MRTLNNWLMRTNLQQLVVHLDDPLYQLKEIKLKYKIKSMFIIIKTFEKIK